MMTEQPDGPAARSLAELSRLLPFAQTLGAVIESADASAVVGALEWAPGLCTTGGALHGGALMGFADNLGGLCAYLNLPEGAATATIESKTNFFRGIRSGSVRGTARPLHIGRTTIVVETDLRDDADRRIALTIQTQAVLRPQP
jgi:1,4-dihydroxy-2-naphthoyl-CoA hydrolase